MNWSLNGVRPTFRPDIHYQEELIHKTDNLYVQSSHNICMSSSGEDQIGRSNKDCLNCCSRLKHTASATAHKLEIS